MLLRRVYRIFQRYAAAQITHEAPVPRDQSKHCIAVQSVRIQANRLHVDLSGPADRAEVQVNRTITPAQAIAEADGQTLFRAELPFETGPITVRCDIGLQTCEVMLPGIRPHHMMLQRAKAAVRFVGQLVMLTPAIYRWKRKGDLASREEVKEALGLVVRPPAASLDSRVLASNGSRYHSFGGVTLVMPVFNAFELLDNVLTRVVSHSGDRWRLVLVDDASTDPRIDPLLKGWAKKPELAGQITLISRHQNGGFVAAANDGLAEAQSWPDDPVVLLNSDAFVPEGWLDRLLAPLVDPKVASVTPMSNDAEIFSVPVICQQTELPNGAVDVIDRVAAQLDAGTARASAPTGVGFCMAMAPAFLRKVPFFDTVFGRGYGEENDWCQKTRALGGEHLGIGSLFVEHRGGTSFGSAAKQALLEQNLAKLTKRYPNYDSQVRTFVEEDPLATARLALGMGWANAVCSGPVPVYLGHSMGGGAEIYLQRRITSDLDRIGAAVVVRVGLVQRWRIELHTPLGVTLGQTDETDTLTALIDLLMEREVIYSCGVGARDPLGLPAVLLRLADNGRMPIVVLMHDFYPISPSYTLLGSDGTYQGPPRANGMAQHDTAHAMLGVSLADWQSAWGRLLAVARRIVVFSLSSRDIVATVYPETRQAIEVVPHVVAQLPPKIAAPDVVEGELVIGVLGNIGVHKGAAVVQALSQAMAAQKLGRVVVVGELDGNYSVAPSSVVHGAYKLQDLPGLVARYGISCWCVPSVWPETFSFTTHEALATGMPVFTFDLGGQGDAVSTAIAQGAAGGVLPFDEGQTVDPVVILAALRSLKERQDKVEGRSGDWIS